MSVPEQDIGVLLEAIDELEKKLQIANDMDNKAWDILRGEGTKRSHIVDAALVAHQNFEDALDALEPFRNCHATAAHEIFGPPKKPCNDCDGCRANEILEKNGRKK
jgi:hypothetical protein